MLRPTRSPWLFPFALLQAALLLAVQLSDGAGVHRCPDHDAGIGVTVGQTHGSGHHHMHGTGGGDQGQQHGPCPCLGASLAVSLPQYPSAALRTAPLALFDPVQPQAPRSLTLSSPAYLLPFAIGPPATV